jgi:hypothetical protein
MKYYPGQTVPESGIIVGQWVETGNPETRRYKCPLLDGFADF